MSDSLEDDVAALLTEVAQVLEHDIGWDELREASDLPSALSDLVREGSASDTFHELYKRDRLDITLENLILRPVHQHLFSVETLERCRDRLEYFGAVVTPVAHAAGTVVHAVREGRTATRSYRVEGVQDGRVMGREFWFEQAAGRVCRYSKVVVPLAQIREVRAEHAPVEGVPMGDQPSESYRVKS